MSEFYFMGQMSTYCQVWSPQMINYRTLLFIMFEDVIWTPIRMPFPLHPCYNYLDSDFRISSFQLYLYPLWLLVTVYGLTLYLSFPSNLRSARPPGVLVVHSCLEATIFKCPWRVKHIHLFSLKSLFIFP
jgi:hypothetical protein